MRAATVAASLAAGAAAAALLWRTRVPSDLRLPAVEASTYFGADELERIEAFRGPQRALFGVSLALELAVVAAAAYAAPRFAPALARVARGRVRAGIGVALLVVLAVWVVRAPLALLSHRRRRRYGLSEQGYAGWLRDDLVGLAVTAVLVTIAVGGAMVLARRYGPRWWLVGAPALTVAAVLFVVVQPLVVAPLFNRFEPLRDRELARDVEALAQRMGVDVDTVEVADASRRTTTANAYVAGLGPSRRVVLYDTVLDEFSRGEVLSISAHELAHVARHHLWKGLAWFGLLAVPGVFLVARAADRRGGATEPAAVPLAALVALLFSLATLPLQNVVSRRYEAEADWLALEATRDADAAIALDRRLVRTNLADPDPPRWLTLWLGTHPPPVERIAMAEAWAKRGARTPG